MKKPIVYLFTMCWNEELIIPYFLAHYEAFVDKIFVYDNESTDNSVNLLRSHQKVTVETYSTNNQIRDDVYLDIKNNVWKKYSNECDIVIVCDMDEFLFHKNIPQLLFKFHNSQCSIIKPTGYDMITENHVFDYQKSLVESVTDGVRNKLFDKLITFKPKDINGINYKGGCHYANPIGNVSYYDVEGVKLLHYKRLGLQYVINKMKAYGSRLSDFNKRNGLGYEYTFSENKHIDNFNTVLSRKHNVFDNRVLIIGNSPKVLENKYGNIIDEYPLVVRFNDFVINGFEDHVGSKTDVWVSTFKCTKYAPSDFNEVYYVCPAFLLQGAKIPTGDNVTVISGDFYNYINKIIDVAPLWASSGVVAIYYFLKNNYDVTIHGFDFFQSEKLHYYNDDAKMIGHNSEKEKNSIMKLVRSKKINVLNG